MLQEEQVHQTLHNIKRVSPYGSGAFKVQIETRKKVVVAIFSEEDLESILPLDIRSQMVNNKERLLVWAGNKSMALSRYILEAVKPVENSEKLYVKHLNENCLDFRHENLHWSRNSSGKPKSPKNNRRPKKIVLKWNGHRLLFNTEEESEEALERLKNGELIHNIHQTARRRRRPMTEVSGSSTSDWAIWLRQRQIELCEVREWIGNERIPHPFEDENLRRILIEGWKQFGTDQTRLLAIGLAMWMDRKTQSLLDDSKIKPGLSDNQFCVMMRATNFTDPFEDFQDEFFRAQEKWGQVKMPNPKTSFSAEMVVR